MLKAQALLVASQFTTAELWQGKRLVSKWGNTGEAEPRPETNTSSLAAT